MPDFIINALDEAELAQPIATTNPWPIGSPEQPFILTDSTTVTGLKNSLNALANEGDQATLNINSATVTATLTNDRIELRSTSLPALLATLSLPQVDKSMYVQAATLTGMIDTTTVVNLLDGQLLVDKGVVLAASPLLHQSLQEAGFDTALVYDSRPFELSTSGNITRVANKAWEVPTMLNTTIQEPYLNTGETTDAQDKSLNLNLLLTRNLYTEYGLTRATPGPNSAVNALEPALRSGASSFTYNALTFSIDPGATPPTLHLDSSITYPTTVSEQATFLKSLAAMTSGARGFGFVVDYAHLNLSPESLIDGNSAQDVIDQYGTDDVVGTIRNNVSTLKADLNNAYVATILPMKEAFWSNAAAQLVTQIDQQVDTETLSTTQSITIASQTDLNPILGDITVSLASNNWSTKLSVTTMNDAMQEALNDPAAKAMFAQQLRLQSEGRITLADDPNPVMNTSNIITAVQTAITAEETSATVTTGLLAGSTFDISGTTITLTDPSPAALGALREQTEVDKLINAFKGAGLTLNIDPAVGTALAQPSTLLPVITESEMATLTADLTTWLAANSEGGTHTLTGPPLFQGAQAIVTTNDSGEVSIEFTGMPPQTQKILQHPTIQNDLTALLATNGHTLLSVAVSANSEPNFRIDMHSVARFARNNDTSVALQTLFEMVGNQTQVMDTAIGNLQNQGDTISIPDMMEMQVKMNRLSQFSELSTNVIAGVSQSIQSMARNVK